MVNYACVSILPVNFHPNHLTSLGSPGRAGFVKKALQGSVEPEIDEEAHAGLGLNPVFFGNAFRTLRSIVGID